MRSARRLPVPVTTLTIVTLVLALAGLRPSPLLTSAATVTSAASPFGVAGAMRWPDWGTFDRPADALLQLNASWTREDFVWGLIEPRPGQFQWGSTDRIIQATSSRGVNVLGIISYSTNWASPAREDDGSASATSVYPPDLGKYAAFMRTLVARYKGSVHHWEVWNEPNSSTFWKPAPDARAYAALLKTAYAAVKEVDPSATVLTGGMSGNSVPFLEEMLSAGAGGSFDILALHPYAVPADMAHAREESRPDVHKVVEIELQKYRAFLQRHNLNRPIWITEIGWPARSWQLDDQAQADYLAQAYAQLLASGFVQRVFWYSFKDESAAPEQSWGLVSWGAGNTDLAARRPAFASYATSARLLTGAAGAGNLPLGTAQSVANFDTPASWTRSMNASGEFSTSTVEHHSGPSAARLNYALSAPNQAVDFAPPQPIDLPGKPAQIGVWVKGDGSGNYLSAWLRDRDGELFKASLGSVTAAADGWRYYSARLNSYYFPYERAGGSPANGQIDFPAQFMAFRLENTPDEPPASGTIYLDDLETIDGTGALLSRFNRPDGLSVDVVWSRDAANVQLPTRSDSAEVTDRDGERKTVGASGGFLKLQVGNRPIYVVHKPALLPQPGTTYLGAANPSGQSSPSALCAAVKRAAPVTAAGTLYVQETGHNLGGAFRQYWESHDGLRMLGYPISEELVAPSSDGKQYRQQWFQRARMEYHPENSPPNDVLLGLLGVWNTSGRDFVRSAPASGVYYQQTGHSVKLFQNWWQQHGGLALFGYPLSDEMQERSPTDGKTYSVQYFERNRLEHHPEFAGTANEVLLGLLGAEYLTMQGCK